MDACRAEAKAAYATSMGLTASDVSAADLNTVLEKSAQKRVKETMSNCMAAASDATARAGCKTSSAKEALASTLGQAASAISNKDVEVAVWSASP